MTRDDLVRAVLAAPHADAPRQAFAEWGAARGDLQAELTRLQLEDRNERQRRGSSGVARQAANTLVERYGAGWAAPVLEIGTQPRFARGFVEGVTLDAPTFLARAPELFERAPIRAVTFVDAASHIEAISRSPHLERLVSIQFYNRSHASPLGDGGLRTFAASSHVRNLCMLQLAFNDIGRDGIEALAAARLPKLAYVNLGNNRVDSPVEEYAVDSISGIINNNSIALPELGKDLEAKYGELRWLHAPSLLRMYPPDEGDF